MARGREIRISVRELVEYAYLSGSLDSRFTGMTKAVEGVRYHHKIQGQRKTEAAEAGEEYQKEVAISKVISYKDLVFNISGRIDGILSGNKGLVLEEIKTTMSPLEHIAEDTYPVHWAQAKCYAYMYATECGTLITGIQLTYYNIDSGEMKTFLKPAVLGELEEYFKDLLDKYYNWAYMLQDWSVLRDNSIKDLEFPYTEYRKNQRKLAVAVYKTIEAGKRIFVQAPTGTGKTISALYPAIKALGEGKTEKIFYLTAKTITRQVALDAIVRMRGQGLRIKAIVLTAKDKICFKEEANCNPEYCEYARGYFDKVNAVLKDFFTSEDIVTRELVEAFARSYEVCPFELSLDMASWMDCIICDYNYVFDPRASLKRFFMERENDFVLLVDEAHNLVDRAREMFSAELNKKSFLDIKRRLKSIAPAISKAASSINSIMLAQKKKCEGRSCCIAKEEIKELCKVLKDFNGLCDEWLGANNGVPGHHEVLELYFEAAAFLRIYELLDERYTVYIELYGSDVKLKLFCLDPSKLLGEITGKVKASVFYSATLTPLSYFKDILGGCEEDYNMKLPSPFEASNLSLNIAQDVSTKYVNRENSYDGVADYIGTVAAARRGNYLAFFPSYKYMNEVHAIFTEKYPEVETLLQQPTMTEDEKESFLAGFHDEPVESLIGFAVMGGMFSEGIDLVGERLIGAVVVGVGLPQVCFERDIIMDFFKEKNSMGFEYAYMYPGMNRVMQAAGRVIRSEQDKGVVLLIDERFGSSRYFSMFPQEWLHGKRVRSNIELQKLLKEFWSNSLK